MKKYSPELGQFMFGQRFQEFKCPHWLLTYLGTIELDLKSRKGECANPFANTGAKFKNEVFEVEAYSWNEEVEQKYNFKWKDVEVSWYKYLGRGTSINREVTLDEGRQLLNECCRSLRTIYEETKST